MPQENINKKSWEITRINRIKLNSALNNVLLLNFILRFYFYLKISYLQFCNIYGNTLLCQPIPNYRVIISVVFCLYSLYKCELVRNIKDTGYTTKVFSLFVIQRCSPCFVMQNIPRAILIRPIINLQFCFVIIILSASKHFIASFVFLIFVIQERDVYLLYKIL